MWDTLLWPWAGGGLEAIVPDQVTVDGSGAEVGREVYPAPDFELVLHHMVRN